jgi:hypothetical protein
MKYQLMILAGLLAMSTNGFAASKNKCDELIEAGMPQSAIERCWEQYGKSAHYLESVAEARREYEENNANEIAEQQQIEAERKRLQILQSAIVEKRFTYLDLKNKGFGLPFIALERKFIYKSNGEFKKTEDKSLTSGTNICQFLGFEKAKAVEVNNREIDSSIAKGKALYIKKSSPLFGDTTFNEKPYTNTDPDVVVLYLRAVTCVRSKIANNELMETIKEATKYLAADLNTGAPIINQNVAINTTSRNHIEDEDEDEEEEDDGSDDSPFTHGQ